MLRTLGPDDRGGLVASGNRRPRRDRFEDRDVAGQGEKEAGEAFPWRAWTASALARSTTASATPFPTGPLGELAHSLFVGRDLERIFDFRRDALTAHFATTP
jgi:hypothetical protein